MKDKANFWLGLRIYVIVRLKIVIDWATRALNNSVKEDTVLGYWRG